MNNIQLITENTTYWSSDRRTTIANAQVERKTADKK